MPVALEMDITAKDESDRTRAVLLPRHKGNGRHSRATVLVTQGRERGTARLSGNLKRSCYPYVRAFRLLVRPGGALRALHGRMLHTLSIPVAKPRLQKAVE
jgi:hypothetical protein